MAVGKSICRRLFIIQTLLVGFHERPSFGAPQGGKYIVRLNRGGPRNFGQKKGLRERQFALSSLEDELRHEFKGIRKLKRLDHVGVFVVDAADVDTVESLRAHPDLLYVEKEVEWKLFQETTSADFLPSARRQSPWMNEILGFNSSEADPNVVYSGNQSVLVAIIDSGANVRHPFLEAALSKNTREVSGGLNADNDGNGFVHDVYGANVFSRDGNVGDETSDHGTHVAGLIKAVRDHSIVGHPAAAAVQLLPIKFIGSNGSGSTSGALEALEYAAARGAKVVNASWGSTGQSAFSQALYDGMLELYEKNIFIAVAAGNAVAGAANNNDRVPTYPANFNIPGLMSVASMTPSYSWRDNNFSLDSIELSSFSNYGVNSVDIAAPGSYRDPNNNESGVLSANADFESSGEEFIRKRGTSMATPVLAGVAGVVRALNPSLTAYEVKKLLIDSATKSSALATIRSSAVLHAEAAYAAAATARSQGLAPEPTGSLTRSLNSPGGVQDHVGGCGLVENSSGQGPMGGNSLGLLLFGALIIKAFLAVKRFRKVRV